MLACFHFLLFRAAIMACGSSEARGQIGDTDTGLHTATATGDPNHVCDLHHSLWQHGSFNPLSEARDRTLILKYTSQILNLLSHHENS